MKRWIAVMVVLLLLFASAGCGSLVRRAADKYGDELKDRVGDLIGGDNGDNDDGGRDAGTVPEILVDGEFYTLESFFDIMELFREFEYVWSSGGDAYTVNAQYLGEETVGGSVVKHFILRTEGDWEGDYEFWTSDDPDLNITIYDGQEYTGEMAQMMSEFATAHLMWFFILADSWSDLFTGQGVHDSYGWKLDKKGTVNRNFGAGNVKVERFEFLYKYLNVEATNTFEVAKIGGKNLFVSWDFSSNGDSFEMSVTRMIPR
jgi:hypothetical protein